ncbi:MAG: hypothetical protein OQK98_10530 [Gammaproteobacteria bacterium]|nr:hypothetical protein [Gammaproteobacteria bacterium]
MSNAPEKSAPTTQQPDFFLGLQDEAYMNVEREWYQDNLDIVFPMLFIAAGLFQFIIRKWILPVSEDVLEELENQFPTQSLSYNPQFGLYLMGIGVVLLVIFNINKIF